MTDITHLPPDTGPSLDLHNKDIAVAGQWRLFWMRGNLKWHAYKTKSVNGDLVQLVSEVDEDAWGCFFG